MTTRTKYVALIVGGTPEEPWDVERKYEATDIIQAVARAYVEAQRYDNARVTSIEEVL